MNASCWVGSVVETRMSNCRRSYVATLQVRQQRYATTALPLQDTGC
ncbi:MAG: hypothetical protein RMY31_016715 [Dendronalium sp. ChiSLP03b]